jgi:hypothetical protein
MGVTLLKKALDMNMYNDSINGSWQGTMKSLGCDQILY